MTLLNLEIITPKGYLYRDKCHLVTLPTKAGEIGVMHGHELIIASLEVSGKIAIYDEQEKLLKEFEFSGGGYAKMQGLNTLLVLLD
jgi:F-type H+-transporting ATPase subunit epsilon